MNLSAYYDSLHQTSTTRVAHGTYDVDPLLLPAAQDTRRGITLLARPPAAVTGAITDVLADFGSAEPEQYYYPASDIHLPILSIISCYSGFTLSAIQPADYQRAVQAIAAKVPPFRIVYCGLAVSPSGLIVRGLPEGDGLERLRHQTRQFFQHSGLQQSIDQRYSIQTAHSTVMRFTHRLRDPAAWLAKVERYRQHPFGTFEVNTVELVYNDWYQRAANTVLLEKYALPAPPGRATL